MAMTAQAQIVTAITTVRSRIPLTLPLLKGYSKTEAPKKSLRAGLRGGETARAGEDVADLLLRDAARRARERPFGGRQCFTGPIEAEQ
jgi:hypothetical protein